MEIIICGDTKLYIASDIYEERRDPPSKYLKLVEQLRDKPIIPKGRFDPQCPVGERIPLRKVPTNAPKAKFTNAALFAHGLEDYPTIWTCEDGSNDLPVQEWINHVDGIADNLLVFSCNTYGSRLGSHFSTIIYPRFWISFHKFWNAILPMRVYHPSKGHLLQ